MFNERLVQAFDSVDKDHTPVRATYDLIVDFSVEQLDERGFVVNPIEQQKLREWVRRDLDGKSLAKLLGPANLTPCRLSYWLYVQIRSMIASTRAVHVKELSTHAPCGSFDPNPMISLEEARAFYRQILREDAQ